MGKTDRTFSWNKNAPPKWAISTTSFEDWENTLVLLECKFGWGDKNRILADRTLWPWEHLQIFKSGPDSMKRLFCLFKLDIRTG